MHLDIIQAKGFDIRTYVSNLNANFILLTDIAKYKSEEPNEVIRNWMRRRDTIEFLGLWEQLNNPNLTPSNSKGLKVKQDIMHLQCLPRSGYVGLVQ